MERPRGALLQEALDWCHERGVDFYAANMDEPVTDTQERNKNYSRKIKADLFIDDRNLGGLPRLGTHLRHDPQREDLAGLHLPRSLALEEDEPQPKKTLVEVLRLRWRKIWDCAGERSGTALAKVLTNTTDAKTDNILREKRRAGPYTPLQDVCLGGIFIVATQPPCSSSRRGPWLWP